MKISISKKLLPILFVILLFLKCFGFIALNINALNYIFTVLLIFFIIKYKEPHWYRKTLLIYSFFIFCSCLYSFLYNKQSLFKTIFNSYNYLGLLFLFYIMNLKLNSFQLKKITLWLSLIFCTCYIFQWIIYPITIFSGSLDEVNISDEVFRMRMPGSLCAYILFFYGLNYYIITKNKKNLLYAAFGFLPILIMGFRSLILCTILFALIMIPYVTRDLKKSFKWMLLGCIVAVITSQLPIVQSKIDEMVDRQERGDTFANKDYIRYLEYYYFSDYIFTKEYEHMFGGGVPVFDGKSTYAKNIQDATDTYSYYWNDLGLLGLSFIIGIPAVILFIIIILKSISSCKDRDLQFIRFSMLTVLCASLVTSMEIYRTGNFIIIALLLSIECTKKNEICYEKNIGNKTIHV